jgi:hypothetical protein
MKDREKELIYQQMTQLLNEIHRLMEVYDSWKDQLLNLDEGEKLDKPKELPNNLNSEIENQKYLSGKKTKRSGYDSQTLALDIASFLKDSGRPLSTSEIHGKLVDKGYVLTRSNLTGNILSKINYDSRINVERVCRGYWQYRLIK